MSRKACDAWRTGDSADGAADREPTDHLVPLIDEDLFLWSLRAN
jgi:hypothetical protein